MKQSRWSIDGSSRSRLLGAAIASLAVCAGSLVAAPVASASSRTVTLSVFASTGNLPYPWQITAFEKAYPNIHINLSTVPFGEFYTKTAVLAASSNPPDVFAVDQPTISNLAAGKVILPLTKYLGPAYIKSLTAAARADFTYDGQIYSPGPTDTALALFYNKTYLNKLGIHPPTSISTAWTWPQALSAFQRCQKAYSTSGNTVWGLAPTTFGNGTPGFDYIANLFLRSEGSATAPQSSSARKTFEAISPNGKSVDGYLNSPQAIAGAQFYQDLFQKYKVSPTTGIPNALLDGKACFDMNTSNDISTIRQAHVKFQWAVTPWPHFNTPIVHNGSNEIAVGAKTKHLTQAVDFVKFISSPAQQRETFQKTGYLPVIQSLYSSIAPLRSAPWNIFAEELSKWGQPRPVTPHYLQYSQVVTNALRDIADGASVKSRLNEAVGQLDPLLAQPAGAL